MIIVTVTVRLKNFKLESLLKMKASIRQEVFETLTPCENCESLWEYEDDMRYHLPWCQENRPT